MSQTITGLGKTRCNGTAGGPCNVCVVGVGPHACRTYIPHLQRHAARTGARLSALVELESERPRVEPFCRERGVSAEQVYVAPFSNGVMPADVRNRLDDLLARHRINGIIISTEPLAHRAYLDYALDRGLNILVDKPLTTRRDVANNLGQARGIWGDYCEVLERYRLLQRERTTCLLVNSHRRYHPGFQLALDRIEDIRTRFNQPVTSVSSSHCDGQWRLPAEICEQLYHPYCQGYGKVSHSGYHMLDMVACFLRAGSVPGKTPDTMALTSSFLRPRGFLRQQTRGDFQHYFGAAYDEVCRYSDEELYEQFAPYGEIDARALLEFTLRGDVVAQATIELLHNGFSRRTWVLPGPDLYKGNGRVRHERHEIVSGPFQTVRIESYQAHDKHDRSGPGDVAPGGNNHFDISVFRNCGLTGDPEPLQVYRLADLPGAADFDMGLLFNEQVKEAALLEFLQFIRGEVCLSQIRSNIESHGLTIQIMSGIYEAHALRCMGRLGWVEKQL